MGARKPLHRPAPHIPCADDPEIYPPAATVVRRPSNSPVGAGYMPEALAWAGPYHKPPFFLSSLLLSYPETIGTAGYPL